jgi:hypothetical protein
LEVPLLTLVYMAFAGLGCLYVVLAAFLGHTGDSGGHLDGGAGGGDGPGDGGHAGLGGLLGGHAGGHAGHAADSGHAGHAGHAETAYGVGGGGHGSVQAAAQAAAGFHFPFFSPLALATVVAAIGGWGLIAKYGLDAGDGASLAMAVPAAVLTAYGITYVAWRLVSGSRASSLIRLEQLAGAPAEVTVPIPAGGVGEATAMAGGERYTAPAREVDGGAVARGAMVTIVAAGPTLLVRAGPAAATPKGPAANLDRGNDSTA